MSDLTGKRLRQRRTDPSSGMSSYVHLQMKVSQVRIRVAVFTPMQAPYDHCFFFRRPPQDLWPDDSWNAPPPTEAELAAEAAKAKAANQAAGAEPATHAQAKQRILRCAPQPFTTDFVPQSDSGNPGAKSESHRGAGCLRSSWPTRRRQW